MKTFASITALAMTLGTMTGDARAADPRTIDELAYSLMQQTAAATREVRYGFQHSPQYEHLYQDVYDMYRAASHIHDVAHSAGSRKQILKDVQQLDELVHHIEELIDEMSGHGIGHSAHGRHGHHYYGGSNEYHVRRLRTIMQGIVATVHQLQDVVGYSRPAAPIHYGPPAGGPVFAPPAQFVVPRSPYGGRGFEIRRGNNGRVSFSLRLR